ncbi:MAG: DNA polymerase I [bacterium]
MSKKKSVLLVDIFGLMYKFYFTLPRMTAPDGTPTNAIFGLARVILKLIREQKPDYLVLAVESIKPTFRHEEYKEYKAHRDKMPDDLRTQLPLVDEMFDAMGLAPARVEGYEADDVIGTYARIAEENNLNVSIITGDKDLLQLVTPNVKVMLSKKGVTELDTFTPEKVKEQHSVAPEHIPDLKGLMGDSSDNIPGVHGIGGVTATKLLSEFETLENLYACLDKVEREKIKTALVENKDMAFFSRHLATIKKDISVEKNIEDFEFKGLPTEKVTDFFRRLAMKSLLREVDEAAEEPAAERKGAGGEYTAVYDEKTLERIVAEAKKQKHLCVDVETTGLDPLTCSIVGIALAVEPMRAYYIPIGHIIPESTQQEIFTASDDKHDNPRSAHPQKQLSLKKVLQILKPVLEDPEVAKEGHNLKFDRNVLEGAGVRLEGISFDSMVASYLITPHERRHALKPLAEFMLGIPMRTYHDLVGKGKDEIPFSKVPIAEAVDYAGSDVDVVLRIKDKLMEDLERKGLMGVFRDIEMPLVAVLARMELNGVAIDVEQLAGISAQLRSREDNIRRKIYEITEIEVNLNSPKQVGELLFDHLKLPKIRKTSTDISVLERLQDAHPVVPLLIDYRHLNKLRSTYVDALPTMINPKMSRIHTSFNQTITSTGRLSSSDPNLQNIPIRTEDGSEIRGAFVAPKEHLLLSADYSQIEIRLMAHIADEPTLISAFQRSEDIHSRTAAEVFSVPIDKITPDQRRQAKTINFGVIYGMKEHGLAQQLGISRKEAAVFIESYFDRLPAVRKLIEETREQVVADGYVSTLFGRRRYIPEAKSDDAQQREFGFRAAVNARMQGTAADIMKLAMICIHNEIERGELDAKMILQVHDELVFEVPKKKIKTVAQRVKELMETCIGDVKLKVPLVADIKAGTNWRDCEEV